MHMLADLREVPHRLYKFFRKVLWMRCDEPDPFYSLYFMQLIQKVRKVYILIEFPAIRVHVLAEEVYLLKTLCRKFFSLFVYINRRPAPLPPPRVRDNAVGAEVVAPIHNGHPCLYLSCPLYWKYHRGVIRIYIDKCRLMTIESCECISINQGLQAVYVVWPEDKVNIREPLKELFAFLLGYAAGNRDLEVRIVGLGLLQPSEIAIELMLGLFPYAAGIEDDHVGIAFASRLLVSIFREDSSNLFRVMDIHLATKSL